MSLKEMTSYLKSRCLILTNQFVFISAQQKTIQKSSFLKRKKSGGKPALTLWGKSVQQYNRFYVDAEIVSFEFFLVRNSEGLPHVTT